MFRSATAWRLLSGVLLFLLSQALMYESGLLLGLAGAASAAALLLLGAVLVRATAARPLPPGAIRTAIRERALRTAFLRQRDPDAAGRPRPRAPGAVPATAVQGA